MNYPKLLYRKTSEEGYVNFPKEFDNIHKAIKLDLLQDWIADLQRKYEELLDKEF